MNAAAATADAGPDSRALQTGRSFLDGSVAWLDAKGKGAWIAAMILGFILFWPVGLALLFFMLWSNRMSGSFFCSRGASRRSSTSPTGNSAFDAYRADTLKRLEDEQVAFEGFLHRLRAAKDKTEFDQFMDERAAEVKADSK